jgi:hypothetical protein
MADEYEEALERTRLRMESEFLPILAPDTPIENEARIAVASEYTAYQMGQINRKLDRLIAAIESLTAKL